MTRKIVFAIFCSVVALGICPLGATEPLAIEWNQLVPDKVFEDPFEKLSDDQLQDIVYATAQSEPTNQKTSTRKMHQ
jgi:hypothetical protein